MKIRFKLVWNRFKIGLKLAQNQFKIGLKLVQNKFEIYSKLVRNWFEIGQKLIQNYIDEQALKQGIKSSQIEEIAASDFGLTNAVRVEKFEDYTFQPNLVYSFFLHLCILSSILNTPARNL